MEEEVQGLMKSRISHLSVKTFGIGTKMSSGPTDAVVVCTPCILLDFLVFVFTM